MAIYGMGSMLGRVVGPVLGGYLTDSSQLALDLPDQHPGRRSGERLDVRRPAESQTRKSRFDMFGFAVLSIFLASLQLMIDRGQQLDWFELPEILIEAAVAAATFVIFVIYILTIRDPFITPALFANRNFVAGAIIAIGLGVLIFGAMPCTAPCCSSCWAIRSCLPA